MNPEELNRAFEEAFARVEPKDEAHREKLARMRERIRSSNEEMAREIEKAKEQIARVSRPPSDNVKANAAERFQRGREHLSAVAATFREQAELIDRIAAATRRRDR